MLFKKSEKQDVEATEAVETPEPLAQMNNSTLLELTDEKRDELAVALYHISHSLFTYDEELEKVIEFLGIDITNARYMCRLLNIDREQWNFQQNHRKK